MELFEGAVKVLKNRFVSGITWEIVLQAPYIAQKAQPGQFVMLSVHTSDVKKYDPLNRRPFAVADSCENEGWISVYYDVVGRGTRLLTHLKEGEFIKILGPLGEGIFPIREDKKALVVAGGIGASGVSLLVKKLLEKNIPTVVLYGARNKEYLSMFQWYEKARQKGAKVYYYTDDGSFGIKGFPVQDLDKYIDDPQRWVIYACGPKPLLRFLKNYSYQRKVETYLSLDRRMACGWGVCLGCVVKTQKGFERVCKEGPVFEAQRLVDF
ncbi:MAG: dihydroorotate dehydrogenase electron transfer subunit [Aquificae bacterium]|nr:dihydroorotate dehydrogenase electron transfer subunit [Aquificota bacterium]